MLAKRKKELEQNNLEQRIKTPGSNFLIEGVRNLTNFLFTNVDVSFHGLENLNNINSPIIFAVAPHNGHMDSLFARRTIGKLNNLARKKSVFVAAGDGYWDKQPRKTIASMTARTFTITRQGGKKAKLHMAQVEQIMRQGNHLVVFPEGTRTNIGSPIKDRTFKDGTARWAIATRDLNTVIVPIYIEGAEPMMPPGSTLPKHRRGRGEKKFKVKLIVGPPIRVADQIPNDFEDLPRMNQSIIIKQVTAQIKAFMQALEEYTHIGQSQVKPY